jgi:hypothetical protein
MQEQTGMRSLSTAVFKITRHPERRQAERWALEPVSEGRLEMMGPGGEDLGTFATIQDAVASSEDLHLVRRTDHAEVECPVLDDEALARMLVGRLVARCMINGWSWRWRSTADVVAWLPEDHRSHPRFEETVAELCWTVPSFPGADWEDAGVVSLDRLCGVFWWTMATDSGRTLHSDIYLGRFEQVEDAQIELWDLLDRWGYRLGWNGNPGPHPGGVMALWLPERRIPLNDGWRT